MFRPLLLAAVVMQLLPLQGWGAVAECQVADQVSDDAVSDDARDLAEEDCCSGGCCCEEACLCAVAPPAEEPSSPATPSERRVFIDSPEATPRSHRTSSLTPPLPREVAGLSRDPRALAPVLPWGRSVQVSLCVWTP